MISMVELIGGVSILMALGILLIFVKDSVFDDATTSKLEFQNADHSDSFINIDTELLANDETSELNPELVKEKKQRLESFRLRNKFYQMK